MWEGRHMPPHLEEYTICFKDKIKYALKHVLTCHLEIAFSTSLACDVLKGSMHLTIHGHLGPPPPLLLPKVLGADNPGSSPRRGFNQAGVRYVFCLRSSFCQG